MEKKKENKGFGGRINDKKGQQKRCVERVVGLFAGLLEVENGEMVDGQERNGLYRRGYFHGKEK